MRWMLRIKQQQKRTIWFWPTESLIVSCILSKIINNLEGPITSYITQIRRKFRFHQSYGKLYYCAAKREALLIFSVFFTNKRQLEATCSFVSYDNNCDGYLKKRTVMGILSETKQKPQIFQTFISWSQNKYHNVLIMV